MTIDPLESEWPNFRTLADVIKFTGLTADKDSVAGSLCYLLGLDGSDHPRIFVILAEDDFSKLLEMWKVPVMEGGFITLQDPTPRQSGQAALVGNAVLWLDSSRISHHPPPLQLRLLLLRLPNGRSN